MVNGRLIVLCALKLYFGSDTFLNYSGVQFLFISTVYGVDETLTTKSESRV